VLRFTFVRTVVIPALGVDSATFDSTLDTDLLEALDPGEFGDVGGLRAIVTAVEWVGTRQPSRNVRRDQIEIALARSGNNVSAVARELGMDRGTLHRWMRKWRTE
jgi:transcriptional regulator of acetoin/glycerol metabolism